MSVSNFPTSASAPCWLVVDDEKSVTSTLSALCRAEGYTACMAYNLQDAMEILESEPIDGFLLDYRLPDGNAIQLAETIRDRGHRGPILFVTGFASEQMEQASEPYDVAEIIPKPFTLEKLRSSMHRHLPLPDANGDEQT